MKDQVPFWYHPALCSCLFLWPRVGVWRGDCFSPPLPWASGDWAQAQLLKPLLSPRWTHMSPSHWILYPVSVYININNIYIYIYIYINFVQKACPTVVAAAAHMCVVSVR